MLFILVFTSFFSVSKESFDKTGVSYHQRIDELVPVFVPRLPVYVFGFAPDTGFEKIIRKHKIDEVSCNIFGEEVWNFDSTGKIISYTIYKDDRDGKFRYRTQFRYDDAGYLVYRRTFDLEDEGANKYSGYTEFVEKTFSYNADHSRCAITKRTRIRSLRFADRLWNDNGDCNRTEKQICHLNARRQVTHISGDYLGHKSEVDFTYDGAGNLLARTVEFRDVSGGFTDKLEYVQNGDKTEARHFFTLTVPGQTPFSELLETREYDSKKRVVAGHAGKDIHFFSESREAETGHSYRAIYRGDTLDEETEFDMAGNVFSQRSYRYERTEPGVIVHCIWLAPDSSGRIDSICRQSTWIDVTGLVTKVELNYFRKNEIPAGMFLPGFLYFDDKRGIIFNYKTRS
jgi:hypothetical protein